LQNLSIKKLSGNNLLLNDFGPYVKIVMNVCFITVDMESCLFGGKRFLYLWDRKNRSHGNAAKGI
jgi:hypothetical protein